MINNIRNRDINKWKELPYCEKFYWLPRLSIGTAFDYFNINVGGDVVVNGSYRTGNIGDLAIGSIIKMEIEKRYNRKCKLNGCNFLKQNFSKFNIYIIGGGALFDGDHLVNKLLPLKNAKKSMIMGNSITKITSKKNKKVLKLINEADLITVRDKKSKEYLEQLINKEINVTADPAFLFKKHNHKQIENSLGISLKFLPLNENKKNKKLIEFINNNLKKLTKEFKLFFISFSPEDTIVIRKYFKKYSTNIIYARTPDKTLEAIEKMERMICMRLHSLIFSLVAEKPLFIINYDEKMDELCERMKHFINVSKINEKDIMCFNNNRNDIKKIKMEYQKRAEMNFDLFSKLVHR